MTSDHQHLQSLLNQGRYFEAKALTEKLLEQGENLRYQQLYALALSKSGAPEAALDFLGPVYSRYPTDPETAGILGGIYKELFRKTQNSSFAVLSRDTYLKNFRATTSYYTGINAASMSAIAGQARLGREIAREVIASLNGTTDEFWILATLAEAFLLTKEREKSLDCYFRCRKLAGSDWGKVSSIYHQLWLLNHYIPVPSDVLKAFNPPGVAAFAGHMIDHPLRSKMRFPPQIENDIKDAIKTAIKTLNVNIGYCYLACGGDILFAEALSEAGGEVNIIIPFAMDDFVEVSVRFAGEHWVERFNKLVTRFPVKFISEERYRNHTDFFLFQSKVVFGSAVLRSDLQINKPSLITVLSAFDTSARNGGTRDTLALWPYRENIVNINPDRYTDSLPELTSGSSVDDREQDEAAAKQGKRQEWKLWIVVVADFLNTEKEIQRELLSRMLETTREMSAPAESSGLKQNCFYAAFSSVSAVLETEEMIRKIVPAQMHSYLRISFHAGPYSLSVEDEKPMISGRQMEIAQAIHVQLASGASYGAGSFSAILALEYPAFEMHYAGIINLDNELGKHEIYKLTGL